MALPISGALAAVSMVNRALFNSSPKNSDYLQQVATAGNTADGQYLFAKQLGASFASESPADLAALALSNLGVSATTIPEESFDILLAAVTEYIAYHGTHNFGVISLQLGQLLSNLEGDVTFGGAAAAWNQKVVLSHEYSLNPANTVPQVGDDMGVGQTFTLTENVLVTDAVLADIEPIVKTITYIGFNPHAHGENGVDNLTNETITDGGVPLYDVLDVDGTSVLQKGFFSYIADIVGLDFVQLGLINVGDDLGTLAGALTIGDITGNSNVTTVTVTAADGTVHTAEVDINNAYFKLLTSLVFDEESNLRLFEKQIKIYPQVTIELPDGTAYQQTVYQYVSEAETTTIVPIILTTTANNGGTRTDAGERATTTFGDDLIVAGRLELLHGAYIDGGGGSNTLEVDAKGYYAQPTELLNIQHVKVQNLPNVYSGDPDAVSPQQNSVLDLSRAVDIETLTVTESHFDGLSDTQATPGSLTLSGIRNGAETTIDGSFTQNVYLHYGELQGTGVDLVLNNVNFDSSAQLVVAHNSPTLNIESTGGGNYIGNGNLGAVNGYALGNGALTTLNITGDAHLFIEGDLDASFHDEQAVVIDASANTGGVNLRLTESEKVTFHGSQANDRFLVSTSDASGLVGANGDDDSVTIIDLMGDNHFEVDSTTINVTVGDGRNTIELEGDVATVVAGNGNNNIAVDQDASFDAVTVTVGNGNNTINTDDTAVVSITSGTGNNSISSVRGDSVTINAAGGNNTITVSADEMAITTGAGNDTIVISGMGLAEIGDAETVASPTALLNIDTGAGNNTVVLGRDLFGDIGFGITALEGSSITGENITLYVENASDLRAATLSGIDNVVLNYDINTSNNANRSIEPALTLTDVQFMAIGAANFNVEGSVFSTYAQIKIIVTESTSLADLGVSALPRNLDLQLELQDGVTLTMTAEELHTNVAPGGITLANDGNTDLVAGKVVILGGGLNFDPFNTNDTVKTNIGGNIYFGGSLSDDFKVDDTYYNVEVKSLVNGWDRPADAEAEVVITLDSGTGLGNIEQGAFSSWHTNLEIVGEKDINFTGAIQLGMNQGAPENPFTIDFSQLQAEVNNFTVDNFELLGQGGGIYGNADAGYNSTVNIIIAADSGIDGVGFDEVDAGSLVSNGVAKYVVTTIEGPTAAGSTGSTATIKLCDTTQDLEVLALRGNWNDTLNVVDAAWGLAFELQGGTTAKADGPTGTANVGKLVASYEWGGADAVVNLAHSVAGDTRTIKAYGIEVNNADSITVNVAGSATIDAIAGSSLDELVLNSTGNVEVAAVLPALDAIDASGVTGTLTVAIDNPTEGLTIVGAAGATQLTIDDAAEGAIASISGEGEISLHIGNGVGADSVDLSKTALSNVTSVTLDNASTLTLTMEQADVIGSANFAVASGETATLSLEGLSDQPFAKANYDVQGTLDITVSLATLPEITLNALTDLTGIASLAVPAGTTLNLTAAQFQQLNGDGIITMIGSGAVTVNITDLSTADLVDGFDVAGVAPGITLNLQVVGDIDLSGATLTGVDSITFGDEATLTLGDIQQANGVKIQGGDNSNLVFKDTGTALFETIDASGFDVTYLKHTNTLTAGGNRNIDDIFTGLAETITKVIYNGEGSVNAVDQTVIIEAGTTVLDSLVYNKAEADVELQDFTINLMGGVELSGHLRLSTGDKFADANGDKIKDADENYLIREYLKTLTINSTGTAENLLTGAAANIIDGDVTPMGINGSLNNNLLDVTINASQALTITGKLVFNSNVGNDNGGDGMTVNDVEDAVATLTVTGTADVNVGTIDTSDVDVAGLNVVNEGSGTITATINSANVPNADVLSFTGTGDVHLNVVGAVDLSGDTLTAVSQITIADGAVLTLSQAQFDALGAANIIDGGVDGSAILNLNGVNAAFDATTIDANIDVQTLTLEGSMDFAATASNLTGVDSIVVPEGATLTLTAAQFKQLNAGAITGATTNYTVNITNLTQADIDGGAFVTTGILADTITLSLGEDVNLSADDVITNVDSVILADGQTLGLASAAQANGLNVAGGADTTIVFQFSPHATFFGQINAAGYNVTTLKALANGFTTGANSNVEYSIDDLPSAVILRLYADPAELGFLDPTYRVVVIEEGITTPTGLIFNDWDQTDEVRSLTLTLEGGAVLNGDLSIPTRTDKAGGTQQYFNQLTINSEGAQANVINGNINTVAGPAAGNTSDNNLLNVVINATQDLVVDGDIVFNSRDVAGDDAVASLVVTGAGNVSIEQLNVLDDDIDVLNVANDGTGTLTVTGASPAIDGDDSIETINLSGTGDIVFGVHPDVAVTSEWGISAAGLSTLDASALSGDLTLGEVRDVDSANFTFTAGSGVTKLTMSADTLDAAQATDTGWTFDFTTAAAGSEFHLGSPTQGAPVFTDGPLTINLGANTTLYIDKTTDLTGIDLTLLQTQDIVLADGATLTLTAAQANGLNIVGANGSDSTGEVNITQLGTAAYDLSGISADIAGTITLASNDVTLDAATDLGAFSVTLTEMADTSVSLLGQTIRFSTEAQATREILVDQGADIADLGDSSTNVVWLFDTITAVGGIDTSGYDQAIGRLWVSTDLIDNQGGDVEQLFTTLPGTILRADFGTLSQLNVLLQSNAVDRKMEITSFNTLGDLTFNDVGLSPVEHLSSLTLSLGGQVTVGNIEVADVVGAPGYDASSVSFGGITINSHRSVKTGDLLATEGYVNDNDGVNESKEASDGAPAGVTGNENALPVNMNTVGNLSVGADNGLDLLVVNLNTGLLTTVDNSSAGQGAALTVGTITYETDEAAETAELNITGVNDITISSVIVTDPGFNAVTVNAAGFSGTLSAPGTSPGIQLGAQVETLTFLNDASDASDARGVVNLGSADVANPNAGITGAGLSLIDASAFGGTLNLGILALIDGTNDGLLQAAFTLETGTGVTTATLGKDPDSADVPTLAAGSEWVFDYTDAAAESRLTITDDVVFGAPVAPATALPKLTLKNVDLYIQGDVDLTGVNLDDIDAGSAIFVAAGNSLTLTHEQVEALTATITGEGTVYVAGEVDTDLAVALNLSNIQTVGVDLSGLTNAGVTVDQVHPVGVTLNTAGALNDADTPVGFNFTGSGFEDAVTGSSLDDVLDGGAGDDTLTGGTGDDTFLVTAGSDIITDLSSDDVLVVSAGATANATDIAEFIATADTVNNGTANLTTDGGVINVALAGGSNGFNLTGDLQADTLVGSNQADVIVGGGDDQSAGQFDTLTGNGGADTFRFVTSTSTPQTLTVEGLANGAPNKAGIDWERINVTASAIVGDGTVTIPYSVNGVVAATPITVVLEGGETAAAIASAIAAEFSTAGYTTAVVGESVEVRGANGVQLEFGTVDLGTTTGIMLAYAEGAAPNNDQAQVTRIQLSTDDPIVAGETYMLNITLLGTSTSVQVSYTALTGDGWADVTQGLETKITALGGAAISAVNGSNAGEHYLDITDVVADDGGFSVTASSTGGFGGSSASDTNANAWNSSDVITDFVSGTDKVDFQGLVAGSSDNYAEAAEVADYATALADANAAFNGTVRYYLTSVTDIDSGTAGNQASGVLFFDADADGTVDGAVRLTGVSSENFAYTDIIASV